MVESPDITGFGRSETRSRGTPLISAIDKRSINAGALACEAVGMIPVTNWVGKKKVLDLDDGMVRPKP